jgi:ABC-type uncharacterized transport system permease subunit
MITIDYRPAARQIRSFARIWLPLFVVALGGMLWWRTGRFTPTVWVWAVGGAISLATLASFQVARLVFVGIVSNLVLGAMFFLVFTPLGILMRLFGRDALALRARKRPSHWVRYEQDDRPERAFRQF